MLLRPWLMKRVVVVLEVVRMKGCFCIFQVV